MESIQVKIEKLQDQYSKSREGIEKLLKEMLTVERNDIEEDGISVSTISHKGNYDDVLIHKTGEECFFGEILGNGEKMEFDVDDISSIDEKLYLLERLGDYDINK